MARQRRNSPARQRRVLAPMHRSTLLHGRRSSPDVARRDEGQVVSRLPARPGGWPLPAAKRKRLTARRIATTNPASTSSPGTSPTSSIGDLEPPVGTQRLEEFLDAQWGESAGGHTTRTSSSCATSSSSRCCAGSCTATRRCRSSAPKGATCTARPSATTRRRAIVAAQDELRDRIALPAAARLRAPQGRA